MPYENEHSCRLKPPNYKNYARKNCYKKHDGKCIDFVFGIIGPDESELQSMRYPKDIWSESDARAHCKEQDGTFEPAKKEEEKSSIDIERRYLSIQEMRASKTDDGKMIIEGYPIVYEKYANLWGFKEIIRKGAATEALKRSDEMVLWDHETDQPMARKKNETLEVKEDEKGVFIRADVSKTVWGRNGYEAILNDIVDKMSFAFNIARGGDNWYWEEIDGVEIEVREIIQFQEIFDYSPVSYPAYKETVVNARNKELALRNKPDPGMPGEAGGTPPEVQKESRDNIQRMRESINERLKL
jgi:HK97 family phage prohead protease